MKYAQKDLTGSLLFLAVFCICFRAVPSPAQTQTQTQTPGATAWSATQQVISQDISSATANALYSGAQTLSSKLHAKSSKKQGAASTVQESSAPAKPPPPPPAPATVSDEPVPPSQAQPNAYKSYNARRTLFVELAQKKLRLEAPEKMCFLDRTSPMQESIYQLLAAIVEKKRDQVLLGVFMACDNILSPADWQDGMPDAGFVTWMNPSVGELTRMGRPDYLDMREASFLQYSQDRGLGLHPDKTVHRTEYNVSVAVADEMPGSDGLRHKSTSVLATTTVRHVPVEFTLHYAGDVYPGGVAPKFDQAYVLMDKLMAQQIALNE